MTAAPPTVSNQTPKLAWLAGKQVRLTLPADAFTDPQALPMVYTATLYDGTGLPGWLAFDTATRTFSGTPPSAAAGMLYLKVNATDSAGLSNYEYISVHVVMSPAPVIVAQTEAKTVYENHAFSFSVAGAFADPQGEAMTYAAAIASTSSAALPDWLHFDAATQTFSGTVPAAAQSLYVKVTATDTDGNDEYFKLNGVMDTPVLASQTPPRQITSLRPFSFSLPANTFTDPLQEHPHTRRRQPAALRREE